MQRWTAAPLLAPSARHFALFAVAASLVLPLGRFGVDICALHFVTGLPCPGCGLTRAFVALSHGQLSDAVAMNPFVLVLFPFFVALALLVFLPDRAERRVEAFLVRHGAGIGAGYRVFLTAFLTFGLLRLIVFLAMGERFP